MNTLARVLIPGVLAGVAISLIANIVIGGIFYNLFNNTAVGTLAGTLTASVVGAILGVIAISTANRKGYGSRAASRGCGCADKHGRRLLWQHKTRRRWMAS